MPPADRFTGCPLEGLTLEERCALAGKYVALAVYSPSTLPLRRIEAIGDSPQDCIRQIAARGLDPRNFEYRLMLPAF